MSNPIPAPRPFFTSRPFLFILAVWLISMAVLFIGDANTAYLALSSLGYAVLLAVFVRWLIPAVTVEDGAFDAAPPKPSLKARTAIVICFVAFTLLLGFAGGGTQHGIQVPLLTPMLAKMYATRVPLNDSVVPYFNFAYLALVPGAILLLLGLRPAALGLKRAAPGTGRAILACMIVPAIIISLSLLHGKATLLGIAFLAIHNLFSNGFSEEFSMRGIVMSQLKAYVSTEWALVLQAVLFGLIHAGGTVVEEHWNPWLIVANVLALNMPIALTLGFMALRSRSLLLPSVVHVSLDTMGRLVGAM